VVVVVIFFMMVMVVVFFFFLRREWSRMLSSSVRGTGVEMTVSSSIMMGWLGDPRRRRWSIWVKEEDIA